MDEVDISALSIYNKPQPCGSEERGGRSRGTTNGAADIDIIYPFLSDDVTISHVRHSRVMFLMRGPPGCGKSTVVRRLQQIYRDIVVCSADDFFFTGDGEYVWDRTKLSEAHVACQKKAQKAAENGQNIVVDNTNIQRWEMNHYYEIAHRCRYILIVVIPRTSWMLQPAQLTQRNTHGVSFSMVKKKVDCFQKVCPLYWAWFLNADETSKLLTLACQYFTACVAKVPDFAQYLRNCFNLTDEEDLVFPDHYGLRSSKLQLLHCTAFYAGHSDAEDVAGYASKDVVRQAEGKCFPLEVTGIAITRRSVCARVRLSADQLLLYRRDEIERSPAVASRLAVTESQTESSAVCQSSVTVDKHSRAHITLGHTTDTEPVQAGDDLLQLLRLYKQCRTVAGPYSVRDLTISYYGEGRCFVQLLRPMQFASLFSGCY